MSGPGGRLFHVTLNGTQVLTNFDIFAAAGAKFKAVTRQFTVAASGSGQIILQFAQGAQNEAKIGGIEISPVPPPRISALFVTNGYVTLTWESYRGRTYRVLCKNDLAEANWLIFGNDAVAQGNTLSITNLLGTNAQQFYRVLQVN